MAFSPWNFVFLIGFMAYVAIRGVYSRHAKGNVIVLSRAGTGDRILIFIMIVGGLLLPTIYLSTNWLGFADYHLPVIARWCGGILIGVSLWLFWRSHVDLARNWSITLELREGHQLITQGVYRWIRHPMYASIWLFGLAQGLLLENWLAGWSAFVAFVPMYFVRVPREEQMMCEYFGKDYLNYKRRTGRIMPAFLRARGSNEKC